MTKPTVNRNKTALKRLLLLLAGLPAIYLGWQYYQQSQDYQSTDNAYIGANVVQIASRLSGQIEQLPVHNHQQVSQGALLFKLDSEALKLTVAEHEARFKQTSQNLGINVLAVASARARLDEKKIQLENAKQLAKRHTQLVDQKFLSQQSFDDSASNLASAEAGVRQAESELHQALEKIRLQEDRDPAMQEAIVKLEQARLNLQYAEVFAPVSGTIANLNLRPGNYVQAGQALFALIDHQSWWVDANFKETQISNIKPGNPAKIHIDLCPDQALSGTVESIAGATGASFSLLPAQNASANWVKVTQRIPVRIRIDSRSDSCPLIIGSSAEVSVAVR